MSHSTPVKIVEYVLAIALMGLMGLSWANDGMNPTQRDTAIILIVALVLLTVWRRVSPGRSTRLR